MGQSVFPPLTSFSLRLEALGEGAIRLVAEKKKAGGPGRKPPAGGPKKQMLTSIDPGIIRRIKAAAALKDTTASAVMEEGLRVARAPSGREEIGQRSTTADAYPSNRPIPLSHPERERPQQSPRPARRATALRLFMWHA
ncbi:hypothetical protein QCM80_38360 [Bradyrhizobium sp. SSUT112]|uniref:hypothetical protein n=1 Tax=Bradyrhizobium sp. SSUT112 TaxID=3040604 RepID=UPI00244AC081|nr:hypothetical protein [Bradyrhizobium sp. SSUT112]MDH2356475.1 hypothetical protein [Bradyrhizobium sp. SSUT112]